MRQKRIQDERCELDESGWPQYVKTARNNATIEVSWSQVSETHEAVDEFSEAVAAYAASLACSGAEEEWAGEIAVQAGLITHLTSLVLVAEDGPIQQDLPKTIKQALPSLQDMRIYASAPLLSDSRMGICDLPIRDVEAFDDHKVYAPLSDVDDSDRAFHEETIIDWDAIKRIGAQIDWQTAGFQLAKGYLEGIPNTVVSEIRDMEDEVADFADQFGIAKLLFVIALAAYTAQDSSKWSARVYRWIIKDFEPEKFARLANDIRLAR